jgi:hypothetical protein
MRRYAGNASYFGQERAREPRLTATTGAVAKGGAVKRRTP